MRQILFECRRLFFHKYGTILLLKNVGAVGGTGDFPFGPSKVNGNSFPTDGVHDRVYPLNIPCMDPDAVPVLMCLRRVRAPRGSPILQLRSAGSNVGWIYTGVY